MNRMLYFLVASAFAHAALAGSLDPSGPPAPTMKTLSAVEPRVAIDTLSGSATAQFVITEPGSYYLTGNVQGVAGKAAVQISANDVSIDLGGFSLIGAVGALDAIVADTGVRNVSVTNGSFRGWPNAAINVDGVIGCAIHSVRVDACGSNYTAILGGYSCTIDNATVIGSTGDIAIFVHWASIVSHSTVRGTHTGIFAQENSAVSDCNVSDFSGAGIVVQNRGLVLNNTVRGGDQGISIGDGVIVKGNSVCEAQTGIISEAIGASIESNVLGFNTVGIHISGGSVGRGFRIQDNVIHSGTTGILVDGGATRNIIIRNTAYNNTTNYAIASGNTVGPIVNSTAGGTITSTNPWANFSY